MVNDVNKFIMPNGDEIDIIGGGLEVCDIGLALYIDETKCLRRYLNGQIVDINANTQAFLNRLKEIQTTNPDNFTTEENWQAEALLNIDGCVYKFVLNYADDGETVVSVRLPKYPDYVEINAGGTLPVVGNGMALGVTNGSGTGALNISTINSTIYSGNISKPVGTVNSGSQIYNNNYVGVGVTTNPTKSGIQTTLKQTKLKLRYFIQIATGSETEANIVNTLENVNGFTLLESKYSDKPLYNESWLLSNGQWNAKAVYPTAYEGLQVEYNTEIEAGTTVTLPSGVSYTKRGLSVKLSTEEYTDYDFRLNTADETFRLPLDTIDHPINSTGTLPVKGNGMTLGFSDNTGLADRSDGTLGRKTADYGSLANTQSSGAAVVTLNRLGVTTDPTKSGIVADLTAKKANLYLYFYVGDIDQNHGIVNMGRIGEQLATKTDMLQASSASMPSSKFINLTLGASGTTYTAPANGYFFISKVSGITNAYIQLANTATWMTSITFANTATDWAFAWLPAKKGDVIDVIYSATGKTNSFRFIYAQGEV